MHEADNMIRMFTKENLTTVPCRILHKAINGKINCDLAKVDTSHPMIETNHADLYVQQHFVYLIIQHGLEAQWITLHIRQPRLQDRRTFITGVPYRPKA